MPEFTLDKKTILQKLTGVSDPDLALNALLKRYVILELAHYTQKNKEYEEKWDMTFDEFYEKYEPSTEADKIEELWDWDVISSAIEFYTQLSEQWT